MTGVAVGFLPEDRHLFRRAESLGDALHEIARALAPQNTTKAITRRWGLDPSTAENVTKKLASGPTVVKAVRAEGDHAWALWDALGELIIGESRDEYDERALQLLLQRTELARQSIEARIARRGELAARADQLAKAGLGLGASRLPPVAR